jgi:signal transduction histidine kinase
MVGLEGIVAAMRGWWHPAYRSRKASPPELSLRGAGSIAAPRVALARDYRWFLLRIEPVRDKSGAIIRWYGVGTDIHDRKLAEDGVKRSRALLAEAQRLAGLGTFAWRPGADASSWRDMLRDMFESTDATSSKEGGAVDRFSDCAQASAAVVFEKIGSKMDRQENVEDQIRIELPSGAIKYLHYRAFATTALSGEVEYVGIAQDITERHLASEALARAQSDLAQAARASSLGVLTASIAHEVNQPLAGVITNASTCLRMLSSGTPNIAGAMETARKIIRDGTRAADVISRLRKLFSQKEINATWWNLEAATREVVELVQSELRMNGVALEEQYGQGVRLIKGDRIQLQQVTLNLIRNAIEAIQAAPEGLRRVVVSVGFTDDTAVLSVRDSGIGLDHSATEQLFETFYTTKKNGMGIGLSVSRWIVEAHGGSLWAEKNDDAGATFGFSIPGHGVGAADDMPA